MKESSGPVRGEFLVTQVDSWSDPQAVNLTPIRVAFNDALCGDIEANFWEQRAGSKYVTLMHVDDVMRYSKPYPFPKRDRRGWVVLGPDTTTGRTDTLPAQPAHSNL